MAIILSNTIRGGIIKMSNKLKGIVLGLLIVGTCITTVFAFSGPSYAENEVLEVGAESNYVLREYEGYVAVYVENDPSLPMTITDIHVGTLRDIDRQSLQTGLKIKSHERLLTILEDLGS